MAKEWLSTDYCVGFNADRGVMLDLDNMTFRSALRTAETLLRQYRLEGFLLTRSSPENYHVVFNRYMSWKKITMIVCSKYECLRWAIFKLREGQLTLRISRKNGKNKPKICVDSAKRISLSKTIWMLTKRSKITDRRRLFRLAHSRLGGEERAPF